MIAAAIRSGTDVLLKYHYSKPFQSGEEFLLLIISDQQIYMSSLLRDIVLKEVLRIADQLIHSAETSDHGIFWRTLKGSNESEPRWETRECIYSGNSGILLFFIALYRFTDNEKYKAVSEQIAKWLITHARNNPSSFYTFYSGRMGIAYSLIKLYEITQNKEYQKEAIDISLASSDFIKDNNALCEMLSGVAGTIVALLHIHNLSQDERLLCVINLFTEYLVKSVEHGKQGIYWDRSYYNTRGLCGFSHGVSGICFSLLELGNYLGNKSLMALAYQGISYESFHYKKSINNWPDFRTSVTSDNTLYKMKQGIISGDFSEFNKAGNFNAWCHGAAGIGLTRLRLFELTGNETENFNDIQNALLKTIDSDILSENPFHSFSLCHGIGGNMELLIEAYNVLGNGELLDKVWNVSQKALNEIKVNNFYRCGSPHYSHLEDTSLFMGIAGIGYFYLRLLSPSSVESVLLPKVTGVIANTESLKNYPFLSMDHQLIKDHIIRKIYPQTLDIMKRNFREEFAVFYDTKERNISWRSQFENIIRSHLSVRNNQYLLSTFSFEYEKVALDHSLDNNTLLYVQSIISKEKAQALRHLSDEALFQKTFVLHPHIKLKEFIRSEQAEEDYFFLLIPTYKGIKELQITHTLYDIICVFLERKTILSAMENYRRFGMNDEQEKMVIAQIRNLINAAIITEIN